MTRRHRVELISPQPKGLYLHVWNAEWSVVSYRSIVLRFPATETVLLSHQGHQEWVDNCTYYSQGNKVVIGAKYFG